MNTRNSTLLLIGSAKPAGASTSEALGTYLLDKLAEQGFTTEKAYVHRALRTEMRIRKLCAAVDAADLFILAFPLYVDGLSYLTTRALERIASHRQAEETSRRPRLLVIANCGFPEAHHNRLALAMCQQFARQAGLDWTGGLSLGGGTPFGGQPLAEAGGKAHHVRVALDLTAKALAVGRDVPDEAISLMARPWISPRLYVVMGEVGWRVGALRNGVYRQLHARPLLHNNVA